MNKPSRKLTPGFGQQMPITYPFERVQIDITGPFNVTANGNKYIVTAIDQLTKLVEMRAIPSQNAVEIGKFIVEDIFNRYGPPKHLLSDRGKVFMSEIVEAIVAINPPCKQLYTSGYHPQCNGNVERVQGVIKNILKNYCNTKHDDWDLFISHAKFAYNSKINKTTGFSPFALTYNRQPYNLVDINFHKNDINSKDNFGCEARKRYEKQLKLAAERLKNKQAKAMRRYNENHRQNVFIIGDLVKLKNRYVYREASNKLSLPNYAYKR
ncbi:integrase core domain containing protein-like protein [Leptotrombidium deliense]|uniref:Integrase core domain containing protein-like protein n=1 Tax=Leptotrombidium deliense TaxID=299467 RepID=A0A443SEN5_9ACAR|nr:integrase core domain containing protein-like protein [Leptotrombidium deliense]